MTDFFSVLFDPSMPFLRYALLAGIFSSAAFGVVGSIVVVKRITYIAGAVSHSVLAGIGLSLFLESRYGIEWFSPLLGAVIAAILSAMIIGAVIYYGGEREDTVIGAVWAIGMALGLFLIAKTPGYVDPMSYLFGNILIISQSDLILIAVLDAGIVGVSILFYQQLQAVSFDEVFIRARGINTGFYFFLLLLLTAVTVVLLVTIVGIVMVIALLTIPPAIAGLMSRRLWGMMMVAAFFTMISTSAGLGMSYQADLPTGPVIILVAGVIYIVTLVLRRLLRMREKRKVSGEASSL
ncbi:MAG: metal ABC transporter permease [Spirochaetales bacterium]|nr:metal ABC transporter permease [Spirochaetales bacterium]MCF7938494.1 metal ABC transporter permease [Spirochaetales bacterium]